MTDQRIVSYKTDIWSFGILLWGMVCLSKPFNGTIKEAVKLGYRGNQEDIARYFSCDHVPLWYNTLIMMCLQYKYVDRNITFKQLLKLLEQTREKQLLENDETISCCRQYGENMLILVRRDQMKLLKTYGVMINEYRISFAEILEAVKRGKEQTHDGRTREFSYDVRTKEFSSKDEKPSELVDKLSMGQYWTLAGYEKSNIVVAHREKDSLTKQQIKYLVERNYEHILDTCGGILVRDNHKHSEPHDFPEIILMRLISIGKMETMRISGILINHTWLGNGYVPFI